MTRILVTNDDGVDAPGLQALVDHLQVLGEVWVVAPLTEQSATSHMVSLYSPLRILQRGPRRWAVSGTPTDAVFVALGKLMPDPPDILLSGINRGGNVAADVSYSGTVACALEGALRGVPSIAVSRASFELGDFGPSAEIALQLARQVLDHGLPAGVCLNVNVPPLPAAEIRGVIAAPLGRRQYRNDIDTRTDPRGRTYHWIGGTDVFDAPIPGTDNVEIRAGFATVTPLRVDWTDRAMLDDLRTWELNPW
jgi:5'-nucleotidase